jgi:DNA recombination protein RmuC
MSAGAVVFITIGSLLAGLIIGWVLASRTTAPLKAERDEARTASEEWRLKFNEAVVNLAAEAEKNKRLTEVETQLATEREAAVVLRAQVAAFQSGQEEREKAFEARLAELKEAKDALSAQFSEVGSKLLESAQKQFLDRADDRFRQSEEAAGKNLKALLQPVHERLQRYEETVTKVEQDRRKDFGVLTGQIEAMRTGTERVSAEAAKLVNALRNAPKARGRWGEQQLRNVLESCGLSEHCDFETEVSVAGEEGRLRPDVVVRVPGGQSLVIDAKVSLNAYQDAFGAVDETERTAHLVAHAAAIRAHVNTLGAKAYWSQFPDAPDYVVMFIPGEHFLTAALEQDSTLWDYAFDKKVLLATPTNLIAIARTVAAVWRQEKLAKEARQIGELGKELYERLAKAADDLRKVGSGLSTAVNNYNSFVASFEGRSLVTARKFRDLNIEPAKRDIDVLQPVEALPRYADEDGAEVVALPLPSEDDPPQIAAE